VCVLPRGAKEGVPQIARGRALGLVVGRPARFELFASDDARGDQPGDVVTIDEERFDRLPPVAATFGAAEKSGAAAALAVVLEGELSAIGTLDLACVEIDPAPGVAPRRFRLAFALGSDVPKGSVAPPRDSLAPRSVLPGAKPSARPPILALPDAAREAVDLVFGKSRGDVAPRAVKDLVRDLEKLLGERATWTLPIVRGLYDLLWAGQRGRRRSADHERVFWQLAGFCLRPGFGDAMDAARMAMLAPLAGERIAFPEEARGWQQLFIAWRRVAAGLEEPAQVALRDLVDPYLAPSEAKLKRPKGSPPLAKPEMIELASCLERVPPVRRSALGGWLLEATWTDRDPRLWAAIGRIGARVPAYASVDHVVSELVASRWIDHLLREKWDQMPTAAEAAVRMARVTGDRARDLPERVRKEVAKRLTVVGARAEWVRAVTEHVEEEEQDRVAFFGEAMPVGLHLLDAG
jgi:hypothetical protein